MKLSSYGAPSGALAALLALSGIACVELPEPTPAKTPSYQLIEASSKLAAEAAFVGSTLQLSLLTDDDQIAPIGQNLPQNLTPELWEIAEGASNAFSVTLKGEGLAKLSFNGQTLELTSLDNSADIKATLRAPLPKDAFEGLAIAYPLPKSSPLNFTLPLSAYSQMTPNNSAESRINWSVPWPSTKVNTVLGPEHAVVDGQVTLKAHLGEGLRAQLKVNDQDWGKLRWIIRDDPAPGKDAPSTLHLLQSADFVMIYGLNDDGDFVAELSWQDLSIQSDCLVHKVNPVGLRYPYNSSIVYLKLRDGLDATPEGCALTFNGTLNPLKPQQATLTARYSAQDWSTNTSSLSAPMDVEDP